MDEKPQKRPSSTDSPAGEKRKKRRKKDPYGGDKLMQIAVAYANGTLTSPRGSTEKAVEKTAASRPLARGGFSALGSSALVEEQEDTGTLETVVSKDEKHADDDKMEDDMVGDKKFFCARRMLPVWKARHDILTALERNNVLILTGEAGSGKSTQVPQALCSAPWCTKMIAVTQPRRIAATSLAYRVAAEMGTPLNGKKRNTGTVGYSVRFDTLVPKGTRIKYLTEGRLLQEFLLDRSLSQYSAVIVDEVHERSTNVDLVMGFLRLILNANRPGATQDTDSSSDSSASSNLMWRSGEPLKVVLMSATADVEKLHKLFSTEIGKKSSGTTKAGQAPAEGGVTEAGQAPAESDVKPTEQEPSAPPTTSPLPNEVEIIRVSGRQYPIEIIYKNEPQSSLVASMAETVVAIHKTEQFPGDILAFLPGQDEIYDAIRIIKGQTADLPSNIPRLEVLPLFSQLPKKLQDKALGPAHQSFTRKVILATNIAETSVTVPGVRYVVDGGLAKVKEFDVEKKRDILGNRPISKSSAIQRAGRAGREGAGKCFRLYTQKAFDALELLDTPEILRIDVADAALTIMASGGNPITFPLVSQPSRPRMIQGILQLYGLGAITVENTVSKDGAITLQRKVTEDGLSISKMPLPVAYGRVLLDAWLEDCLLEAIDIIACLTTNGAIFLQRNEDEASETNIQASTNKSKDAVDQKGDQKDGQKDGQDGQDEEDGRDDKDKDSEDDKDERSRNIDELQRDESDLLTYYTTLNKMAEQRDRKWSAWCRDRSIHEGNMRQALRIRSQLRRMCVGLDFLDKKSVTAKPSKFVPMSKEAEKRLLKCFLRAFAFNTAVLKPNGNYETATNEQVFIHPSSVLYAPQAPGLLSGRQSSRRRPPAILFMEQVYTNRNYARIVSEIDPDWIQAAQRHWD